MYVTSRVNPPVDIYSMIASPSYTGQLTLIKNSLGKLDQWVLTEDGLKSPKEVSLKKEDSLTLSPCV